MSKKRIYGFNHIPPEEKEEIIKNYLEGVFLKEISKKYRRKQETIRELLKDAAIYKPRRNANNRKRKNEFNESFFDEETPISAYWAGFLLADGSVSKSIRGNPPYTQEMLHLHLSKEDESHLISFQKHLGLKRSIHWHRDKTQSVCFGIGRKGIVESLEKWGVVPNKTYIWKKPEIKNNLLPHFLRGLWDGDGSNSWNEEKKFKSRGKLTSSPECIEWFIAKTRELGFKGGWSIEDGRKKGEHWAKCYTTGQKNLKNLKKIFLVEGNISLERKWKKIK